VLELAILGLLKESDLHGYELKKRLGEALGAFSSVSFGSVYPALARLEAAGAVRVLEVQRVGESAPPIPLTGSIAGEAAAFRARRAAARRSSPRSARNRKVYAITEAGERLFEELLETWPHGADDDRSFNLKLAFCRFLSPDRRIRLFERRKAQLEERLARTRSRERRSGRTDSYVQSLLEHGAEATERDISWLDRLIATEKRFAAQNVATQNLATQNGGNA
jgi:DNA-binding PadR family transcriptional regulator